ncbi:hypothetical protein PIB30_058217 [Stylosanthes scabra]|uniref:Uncharacterized protein n=1 Tax=Stylosanthes scabra TaxID=79078 RepID=A0ABU6SJV8_9FABA|nr:hypothetical protein [Stylosanthes scabra]
MRHRVRHNLPPSLVLPPSTLPLSLLPPSCLALRRRSRHLSAPFVSELIVSLSSASLLPENPEKESALLNPLESPEVSDFR